MALVSRKLSNANTDLRLPLLAVFVEFRQELFRVFVRIAKPLLHSEAVGGALPSFLSRS